MPSSASWYILKELGPDWGLVFKLIQINLPSLIDSKSFEETDDPTLINSKIQNGSLHMPRPSLNYNKTL